MQVNIKIAIKILRQADLTRARTNIAHRRLRRFLHHFAEFPRRGQPAFAFHDRRFRHQHRPAHFGPGQSRRQSDFVVLLQPEFAVLQHAEEIIHVRRGDFHLDGFFFGYDLARHLPRDVLNLALQISHARFMRVVPDDLQQAFIREAQVFRLQTRRFQRTLHQKPLRNLKLFFFRVTRKPQNLHTVLQGLRNRVQYVRRAHKHHFRQVVLHVQIMVRERVVQFRVKHFHQRRRGIAAEVRGHLVHFIQHENRIRRARLFHHLNNLAGKGADVRAPVAADFRFVAHPAERHAHKLPPGCVSDGHRQ